MEEVFKQLSAHLIKGMMVHDQLAQYYDFLGLRGYKRCHEYHFYCESMMYRKLNRYYVNHHSRLIPEIEIENPNIIPDAWYRYSREDVDTQTKRNAVETGMSKWVEWEDETRKAVSAFIKELWDNEEVSDAMFLNCMLKDVEREYKYAMRKMIELKSINYDIISIMEEQPCLHDKYKQKIREIRHDN